MDSEIKQMCQHKITTVMLRHAPHYRRQPRQPRRHQPLPAPKCSPALPAYPDDSSGTDIHKGVCGALQAGSVWQLLAAMRGEVAKPKEIVAPDRSISRGQGP